MLSRGEKKGLSKKEENREVVRKNLPDRGQADIQGGAAG